MKSVISSSYSTLLVLLATAGSLLMFGWPLIIANNLSNEAEIAQVAFILLMPLMLILILAEVANGNIGSKQLALLGVLIALNAVLRLLGAGTAGIETSFFLIIIAASVFGSGFGFIMGVGSLLVSALLTGGVGPWLPFQMMAAGLIGIGAGQIPKTQSKRIRIGLLVIFAIPASFVYGALMTLWNWPLLAGADSSISYMAGAGFIENLTRFFQYQIVTGGLVWDAGRALTTSVLILVVAPLLLGSLDRASAKGGFVKVSS